jgi:hypothetical protein
MRLVLKGLKMLDKMEDNALYDVYTLMRLFRMKERNVWKLMAFFEKQGKVERITTNYPRKTYFKKVSSSSQQTHTQPLQSEEPSSQSPQKS